MSLAVQHVLAWGCVVSACVVLPRTWQVKSESGSGGSSATRSKAADAGGHRERAAVLDAHPFAWMVVREGRTVVFTWLGLAVIVGVWYWGYWEMKDEWLHAAVAMVTTFFAAFWLKLRVASVASRHLHEHRRAGALELVLSTPLQPPAILRGHLAGLRHQFLGPAIAVVLGATLLLAFALGAERGGADHVEVITFFVVGLVLFGVDLWALSWVGMWQAMRNARYIRAYGTTLFLVLTAPWCAFVVSLVLIGVLAEVLDLFPTLDPTAMMMLVWWTVLSVGTDLGLALRARRLLQRDLPALALDHYGSGQTAPSPRPGLPA